MARRRDPRILLRNIEIAAGDIEDTIGGADLATYIANRLLQTHLERKFITIGEALNQLDRISPELAQRIPDARRIIGFRHKLVHDYDRINSEAVWSAAVNDLPGLRQAVRSLLDEIGNTAPTNREARGSLSGRAARAGEPARDDRRSFGMTADLHHAAWTGDITRIVELIARGGDPNARDRYGQTALHRAAELGLAEAIRTLTELGADVGAGDRHGWTPLHEAAGWGHNPDIITALLEAGADLNAKDRSGRSPLHVAGGWSDDPEMVARLVELGADLEAVDNGGMTPLELARQQGAPVVAKALETAGHPADTAPTPVSESGTEPDSSSTPSM